jgi:hypothetical protein
MAASSYTTHHCRHPVAAPIDTSRSVGTGEWVNAHCHTGVHIALVRLGAPFGRSVVKCYLGRSDDQPRFRRARERAHIIRITPFVGRSVGRPLDLAMGNELTHHALSLSLPSARRSVGRSVRRKVENRNLARSSHFVIGPAKRVAVGRSVGSYV